MPAPEFKAIALSPILPVADLAESLRFYTGVLGFSIRLQSDHYAIVAMGQVTLHLTPAADPGAIDATKSHVSFYLEVEDLAPLWSHVSTFTDRYKTQEPFDRDYGMREFHILDPDGCLIFVGQKPGD